MKTFIYPRASAVNSSSCSSCLRVSLSHDAQPRQYIYLIWLRPILLRVCLRDLRAFAVNSYLPPKSATESSAHRSLQSPAPPPHKTDQSASHPAPADALASADPANPPP